MSQEADRLWERVAKKAESPRVPTPQEAHELFVDAGTEPFSAAQVASIAAHVLSLEQETPRSPMPPSGYVSEEEQRYIRDGVFQLNRNQGDADTEDDALMDRLRSEALMDDNHLPEDE